MTEYHFALILTNTPKDHDQILDYTDALGNAGCTDASIRGHRDGMELLFHREGDSLQAAISSAIADVEKAGFDVSRVEMERQSISI